MDIETDCKRTGNKGVNSIKYLRELLGVSKKKEKRKYDNRGISLDKILFKRNLFNFCFHWGTFNFEHFYFVIFVIVGI